MKFLQSEKGRWERNNTLSGKSASGPAFPDCHLVFRAQMCIVEATREQQEPFLPRGLDGFRANDYLTLRWLQRGERRFPKAMVNIGAIDAEVFEELDLLQEGHNVHNVMPHRCFTNATYRPNRFRSLMQVYHYSGSPEQARARTNDIRGSYGSRQGQTKPQASCPEQWRGDDVAPWLRGFVDFVGTREATRLLEGAGRIHSWPSHINFKEYRRETPALSRNVAKL